MNDLEQADMLQVLVNEIADTVSNAKREFAEKVNSVMTELIGQSENTLLNLSRMVM